MAKFFSRTNDLGKVLSEVIVYNDRAEAIVANNQETGIGIFNFIAMQLEELSPPEKPHSVTGDNYTIYYLGRFAYSGLI